MKIFWILFYGKPQALQNLADYQKNKYGQKLDVPPEDDKIKSPYTGYDFEKEMIRKPRLV